MSTTGVGDRAGRDCGVCCGSLRVVLRRYWVPRSSWVSMGWFSASGVGVGRFAVRLAVWSSGIDRRLAVRFTVRSSRVDRWLAVRLTVRRCWVDGWLAPAGARRCQVRVATSWVHTGRGTGRPSRGRHWRAVRPGGRTATRSTWVGRWSGQG